jgi:hypothetical protein
MPIVVHIVNTPKADVREAYAAAWRAVDERGAHDPPGRLSHAAWLVGDVLHVVDVWDSPDNMRHFMDILVPILDKVKMSLAALPEIGELLNVVHPDDAPWGPSTSNARS